MKHLNIGYQADQGDDDIYEYDLSFFGVGSDSDIDYYDVEPIEINPWYERFNKELGLKNPGENGEEVKLPNNLTKEIREKIQEGYDRHGFNAFVSNLISYNRKVPDPRNEICRKTAYLNLAKCSVVIAFHNEEWSLLMRTVHSIMNRSPDDLLGEILLVDDASDRGKTSHAWRCFWLIT